MKEFVKLLIEKIITHQELVFRVVFWIVAAVILIDVIVVVRRFWIRHKKVKPLPMDEMEGLEFEQFCAEVLRQKGFVDVTLTRASRDFGVDILAEKDGVTYAIQCKRYQTPVGVKAVQEAFAGREYYDRMVGAVLTNQYFTQPAVDAARKLKILLWDRGYLDVMLEEPEEEEK